MREHPELKFGERLIESLALDPAQTVFATMELPWNLASPRLGFEPERVVHVENMERTELDRIEASLADFDVAVGVGGGSCMDCAKYLSWKRNSRLILIPSIVSVDACVTQSVAVREGGKVHYVGHAEAENVLVDYTLVSAAPPRLNRAGAADILSIHTASFDWRLAHEKTGEAYDEDVADQAAEIVVDLENSSSDIRDVNDAGIRKLIELFEAENDLCLGLGSYRPEEGSEHYFAYNAEHVTGKHFIHGELVCLGILLMSRLQENRPEWVEPLLDELGVLYRPADIGIEAGELRETLSTLADYCHKEKLPHTIVFETEMTPSLIDDLISDLV